MPFPVRKIPIETFWDYYISADGKIYYRVGMKEIKYVHAWVHISQRGKSYLRVRLKMKNKKWRMFLIHRLIYMSFIRKDIYNFLVRHLDDNSFNNNLRNLKLGTHEENNGIDREKNGTRYLRGNCYGKKEKEIGTKEETFTPTDDCPF